MVVSNLVMGVADVVYGYPNSRRKIFLLKERTRMTMNILEDVNMTDLLMSLAIITVKISTRKLD